MPTGRGGRAAKQAANARLGAQAQELAQLNREAASQDREGSGARVSRRLQGTGQAPPPPAGTRLSSRLRGRQDDEEGWQSVPREWLNGERQDEEESDDDEEVPQPKLVRSKPSAPLKTGLEMDGSGSDLTELTDSDSPSDSSEEEEDSTEEEEPLKEETDLIPADFVEWETVSSSVANFDSDSSASRYVSTSMNGSMSPNGGKIPNIIWTSAYAKPSNMQQTPSLKSSEYESITFHFLRGSHLISLGGRKATADGRGCHTPEAFISHSCYYNGAGAATGPGDAKDGRGEEEESSTESRG